MKHQQHDHKSHVHYTFQRGSTGFGARWDIAILDISQMSIPSNSSVFFWLETYFRVLSWGPVIYLMELVNFNPDFCWFEFYRFQVEREPRKLFQPTVNNINPSTNIICICLYFREIHEHNTCQRNMIQTQFISSFTFQDKKLCIDTNSEVPSSTNYL